MYNLAPRQFAKYETVKHSAKEYVGTDVHANTLRATFSALKSGKKGIYQHSDEKHLQRYLAEFNFRHTRATLSYNDLMRPEELAGSIKSKRLTYRGLTKSVNRISIKHHAERLFGFEEEEAHGF